MTQEEESVARWRVEIRAEMRALTRDSGKEASGQNGDFWCGNDWVKSDHVWRLWLDSRTAQDRGREALGPDKSDLDLVTVHRLTIMSCQHKDYEPSVKPYDKTINFDNEKI